MTGTPMPLAPAPPGGRRRISDLADRFGWGFADQAVSSLSNFLLGFLVARSVDAAAFGAFSVAYATYLVTVGIVLAHTLTMPLWWWEFEREAAVHRVASAGDGPVRSGPC